MQKATLDQLSHMPIPEPEKPLEGVLSTGSADDLIAELEARGLGWSLDHTGRLIEARVWDWPNVIARYRPATVEPLAKMLAEAMYQIDWTKYPVRHNG